MAQPTVPPLVSRTLARVLFLLAAGDALVSGVLAVLRPGDLFAFVHAGPGEPSKDFLLLVPLLGLLALAQAGVCLVIAWRPREFGSLVLLPLTAHWLGMSVWLWYLAAGTPQGPWMTSVVGLAVHDAVWVPAFAWFLLVWSRWPRCLMARPGR